MAVLNLFVDQEEKPQPMSKKTPFISVQIPVFNDKVAIRCVKKCMKFDYPKDKYEIVIVDDSTDKKLAYKLEEFSVKYPKLIKYIHRENRQGFKPGALQNAMKITRGEIVVLFDSDWQPGRNFLRKIIQPMLKDKKVAIVQAKQTFVNLEETLVSRFAGYILMIYHAVMMPINNKINTVFFCGTAGAIRRSILEEVGGWNAKSITEDADLSVKILARGYKNVWLNLPVPSEVPLTIESFIKQQMRWCYGLTRTFFDNFKLVFTTKKLKLRQKLMISLNTVGNIIAPMVILMTIFGMMGWFLGDPELFQVQDLISFIVKFLYTSGFMIFGIYALHKEDHLKHIPYFIITSMTVSLVLITFNTLAFFRAIFNKPVFWYRTPKVGLAAK
jgi:cellulose synthase/poly-beta-1,6-N-acetylglucosamine synthase-like glycosyltransferase